MPISQAMFTGVSGLSVNSDNMSIISNNIANTQTKGFKFDRGEFEDMLSMDLGGSASFSQIGRGARLRNTSTQFSQGGLTSTNGLTDLAVQGDGFFVVRSTSASNDNSGGFNYTRQGSFHFDKDGYLSDNNAGHVQGYMADKQGRLKPTLEAIRIVKTNLPPAKTNTVEMVLNLDVRADRIEEDFNLEKSADTSNFVSSVTVYDAAGNPHQTEVYFRRSGDNSDNAWEWHAAVDGSEVVDGEKGVASEIASGTIFFDKDGRLVREEYEDASVDFIGGVEPGQKVVFDFGKSIEGEGGDGVGITTSNSSQSTVIQHSQDGYETGNLKTLKIDLDGSIKGVFSNGIERTMANLSLATFNNLAGLKKAGKVAFYSTVESGEPSIGLAQAGNRGSIYASSLEESNVDLATQFVQMILTQRGFQANSRAITTTDSMIEEVVNLKR